MGAQIGIRFWCKRARDGIPDLARLEFEVKRAEHPVDGYVGLCPEGRLCGVIETPCLTTA
jgi:hypothetical protein